MEHVPKINTVGGIELPVTEARGGELQLKGVKFNYPTKLDVEVLKGVDIDIPKNKVIALVGPSGMNIKRYINPLQVAANLQ